MYYILQFFLREGKSFAEVFTFMENLMKTNSKDISQKALGEHILKQYLILSVVILWVWDLQKQNSKKVSQTLKNLDINNIDHLKD